MLPSPFADLAPAACLGTIRENINEAFKCPLLDSFKQLIRTHGIVAVDPPRQGKALRIASVVDTLPSNHESVSRLLGVPRSEGEPVAEDCESTTVGEALCQHPGFKSLFRAGFEGMEHALGVDEGARGQSADTFVLAFVTVGSSLLSLSLFIIAPAPR